MKFGVALRLLRIDAGMSLRALARSIGVSSAYLSRVENGHDPAPTPERLTAIADAIDVSPDMLVELAHQTGAALQDYIDRVPAAGSFFLEVARRNLTAQQLARLRDVLDEDLAPATHVEVGESISHLIGNRLLLGLRCTSMEEVIAAGTACCAADSPLSADDIAARIRDRESEAPTLLGQGVAVPHAVVEGATTSVSLVTVAGGLPVTGPEGQPVSTAFVLLSGERGQPHLEILARVARLARHDVADKLSDVSSPAIARQIIETIERSEPGRSPHSDTGAV